MLDFSKPVKDKGCDHLITHDLPPLHMTWEPAAPKTETRFPV